jgi:hypothetical protein
MQEPHKAASLTSRRFQPFLEPTDAHFRPNITALCHELNQKFQSFSKLWLTARPPIYLVAVISIRHGQSKHLLRSVARRLSENPST